MDKDKEFLEKLKKYIDTKIELEIAIHEAEFHFDHEYSINAERKNNESAWQDLSVLIEAV